MSDAILKEINDKEMIEAIPVSLEAISDFMFMIQTTNKHNRSLWQACEEVRIKMKESHALIKTLIRPCYK